MARAFAITSTNGRDRSAQMTVMEHLGELRHRLVICVAAFSVAAIGAYIAFPHVLTFFRTPYCESIPVGHSCALYVTGPLDAFGIRLDVTGYGGLVLASPVILFELWRFVTPGLRANERRYAITFVLAALGLFAFGGFVAWEIFPHALGFLHSAGGAGIKDLFSPATYLSLILGLMAVVGLAFELPVVLVALELARVITPRQLAHFRRVAIVAIVVAAGVLTPSSDPFSMLAMALPMVLFYELAIVVGRVVTRTR
jgi:sec-independent protein translocase protein TatC